MSDPFYVQCLLLVAHKEKIPDVNNSDPSILERANMQIYALVPHIEQFDRICEIFARNDILVIKSTQFEPPLVEAIKSDQVEVLEILIDKKSVDCSDGLTVFVDTFNIVLLNVLFIGHRINTEDPQFDFLKTETYYEDWQSVIDKENLDIIAALVDSGQELRYRHKNGGTFVHYAVERNLESLLRLLLEKGCNVEALTRQGLTPLHTTVKKDYDLSISDILLEYGANVNAFTGPDHKCSTPLHLAVLSHNYDLVEYFLRKGASVDAECNKGNVLELIVDRYFPPEVLDSVLNYRPNLNNAGNKKAFRIAFQNTGRDIPNRLKEYGFSLQPEDAQNIELITAAVAVGELDVIRDFLKWGAGIYYKANTTVTLKDKEEGIIAKLLNLAIMHWDLDCFNFLLELDDSPSRVSFYFNEIPINTCSYIVASEILNSSDICLASILEILEQQFDVFFGMRRLNKLVREYILKIKAADLDINKEFLQNVGERIFRPWLQKTLKSAPPEDIVTEVEMMTTAMIGDSQVSFYDVLNSTALQMVAILRDTSVVEALLKEEYASVFPSYSSMIKWRFTKALYRRKLLDQGIKMFNFLFRYSPRLPSELLDTILNQLSNLDLMVFTNVCRLPKSKSESL